MCHETVTELTVVSVKINQDKLKLEIIQSTFFDHSGIQVEIKTHLMRKLLMFKQCANLYVIHRSKWDISQGM